MKTNFFKFLIIPLVLISCQKENTYNQDNKINIGVNQKTFFKKTSWLSIL